MLLLLLLFNALLFWFMDKQLSMLLVHYPLNMKVPHVFHWKKVYASLYENS